jgi:putative transcriptional regulator
MSKLGDELVQSARQALDFAKGEAETGAFRVTLPAEVDVKAIRAKLKLTRAEFARRFGIPVGALEDWEQGRGAPDGAARVLLKIIDREPAAVERALGAA